MFVQRMEKQIADTKHLVAYALTRFVTTQFFVSTPYACLSGAQRKNCRHQAPNCISTYLYKHLHFSVRPNCSEARPMAVCPVRRENNCRHHAPNCISTYLHKRLLVSLRPNCSEARPMLKKVANTQSIANAWSVANTQSYSKRLVGRVCYRPMTAYCTIHAILYAFDYTLYTIERLQTIRTTPHTHFDIDSTLCYILHYAICTLHYAHQTCTNTIHTRCTLCTIYHVSYAIHQTLYDVNYTLRTTHYALYTTHYTTLQWPQSWA